MSISSLLDGLLSLGLGVWATLLGFGRVSISPDPEKGEAWRRKWGAILKVAGPLIIVFGLYRLVRAF